MVEVASAASKLQVPKEVKLKEVTEYKIIGNRSKKCRWQKNSYRSITIWY